MNNLTNEDIEFLKELSHELNNQENDGNADPIFWGIQEEKSSTPLADDYGDTYVIWETYEGNEIYNSKDKDCLNDFIECMQQEDEIKDEDGNIMSDEDIRKEIEEFYYNNPYEFIENHNIENYNHGMVEYRYELTDQTGAFLTKRAAKKHIELNHYHYNKPRTYAMTAWRNPEFERLINIIKKIGE